MKIVTINRNFLSKELGLTKGCIIIKINEKEIESIEDLNKLKSLDFKTLYNLEVIYKNGNSKNWWLR